MTLREHLVAARGRLLAAGIAPAEAARDAALLAGLAAGWDRATVVAREKDPAPAGFAGVFEPLVARRARREPVAYIRGSQEFWGRDFIVSPAVLIPRPETEHVIEAALRLGAWDAGRVCDIGTGTGCLAVTLATERPAARVVATDVSAAALAVARLNAARHGVDTRVEYREGPYLAGAAGPFDLVVSNPPYVAERDWEALMPEVRDFEPATALRGGADGLAVVRQVVALSAAALAPGGHLLMEIGCGQADAVRQLVDDRPGLTLLSISPDLQGIPRVAVVGRRGEGRAGDIENSESTTE